MKLVIIDTEHFEVLYTLLRLAVSEPMLQDGEVIVYTTQASANQLVSLPGMRHPLITWNTKETGESPRSFAWRVLDELQKSAPDVLWFSTVADNHLIYARLLKGNPRLRSILSLHNVNGSFEYKLSADIKRFIRFRGKQSLLRKSDVLHVLSDGVAQHLRGRLQSNGPAGKTVGVLPGAFFEPALFAQARYNGTERLKIVVPGSIDERRRSYTQVFSLLEKINQQKLAAEIILLGCFQEGYSESIREKVLKYQSVYDNLETFGGGTVEQPIFDERIRSAHFIWMPSMRDAVIQDGVVERYGVSISSGNTGDIIRFAKPFIAPGFLRFDPGFEPSGFRYDKTQEIAGMIKNLTPSSYLLKAGLAEKLSMRYQLADLRPSFHALLAGNHAGS